MIVDTSVIIAMLYEEPEIGPIVSIMARATGALSMSAANFLEAAIVIDSRSSDALSRRFDDLIVYWQIGMIAVSADQARIARDAYRRYGKGRHPARLNFGDCFAYALSRESGRPLLFTSDDFRQTDVEVAL